MSSSININEMLLDTRDFFSSFVPYLEYFCILPQRYLIKTTNIESIICTLSVTNESTGEKVILKNIKFNCESEMIEYNKYNKSNKSTLPLTTLVQDIVNILKWNPSEQVIIATAGKQSFSYGVKYYCIKDTTGKIIDICIKCKKTNHYIPARCDEMKQLEYNYFDLITNK